MRASCRPVLALFLLVASHGPVAQPVFTHLAEGFTSKNEQVGIVAAQRMFSVPTLAEICASLQAPANLVAVVTEPLQLVLGQWFSYDRLVVLAVDRSGAVLAPVPIAVEVEQIAQPVLALHTDMTADPAGKVLPVSEGSFRFRFTALCEGHSAVAVVRAAVVRP